MIALTLAEVAAATGGTLTPGADPDARVTGPVTADSRDVAAGALFVALPGERADGHDFAAGAIAAGAVAVLAVRDVGVPSVLVPDPLQALGRLARAVLDRLVDGGLTVVAVTGSSGKTSTKDLLATVLAPIGPVVAPFGSFNNELGVPLTALRADETTRVLVVEMGARGPGHIRYLCGIAPPRIGVVLNVGRAHAEVFGDPAATAVAKGELVEALPADGVAVLNLDDPRVAAMATRTRARIVGFGLDPAAQVRAARVVVDEDARAHFDLVTPEGTVGVHLRLRGVHHVGNALAAAAVAREVGLHPTGTASLLAAAEPGSRWRMEVVHRADGLTVVNDAYNANPDSVAAALRALAAMGRGRRSWAVLGEMLELGPTSEAEHRASGELAARLGITDVVAVGAGAAAVADGADGAASPVTTSWRPGDLATALKVLAAAGPGDVVLVKASRGVGLDRLVAGLVSSDAAEWPGGAPGAPGREEVS